MKKWFVAGLVMAVVAVLYFTAHKQQKNKEKEAVIDKYIPADSTTALWFRNSVIYTLDVEVFKDSDGDGVGDFKGLTQKLGYIDSLGADVIWLAPFQPSPNEDDGYDIADFYGIDPRLGTLADFKAFMAAASSHHLKVIMDLVLNHTSNEHPWFQQARQSKISPYHSWYVWSAERPRNYNVGMVFPGVQKEIWTYDSAAKEYYYHRFYNFQPDLNMQNPAVKTEVKKIVKYWLDLGLSGFRLDAVPFFIEVPKTSGEKFDHQFELLTQLRSYVNSLHKNAVLLGEANVLPEETTPYFGANGEGMQMMFNFFVNQHLFYALATGEVKPLAEALQATEKIPKEAQWGQFLRNHDELDLGRLSNGDRNKVYQAFGPEKNMQLYNRGIRRRLAPMMNNNRSELELAYAALFSLPSTPVMRYGDEIGMGDNLALKERETVRTPMQWNEGVNSGFSVAPIPVKPVIDTGRFGYTKVNVATENKEPGSLLRFIRNLIHLRRACPEIAFGSREIVITNSKNILAIKYHWQGSTLVVVSNFSAQDAEADLSPIIKPGQSIKMVLSSNIKGANTTINLQKVGLKGYGFVWYRITG